MLRKLNRRLRKIFLVILAVLVVFNLIDKKDAEKSHKHGYQSEIFDDIW